MKLEVGMYVRTSDGLIKKVNRHDPNENNPLWETLNGTVQMKGTITKSSYNIIDLIEVGDYVNGMLVMEIKDNKLFTNDIEWNEVEDLETDDYGRICGYGFKKLPIESIKEVLTHELYESMVYKIER